MQYHNNKNSKNYKISLALCVLLIAALLCYELPFFKAFDMGLPMAFAAETSPAAEEDSGDAKERPKETQAALGQTEQSNEAQTAQRPETQGKKPSEGGDEINSQAVTTSAAGERETLSPSASGQQGASQEHSSSGTIQSSAAQSSAAQSSATQSSETQFSVAQSSVAQPSSAEETSLAQASAAPSSSAQPTSTAAAYMRQELSITAVGYQGNRIVHDNYVLTNDDVTVYYSLQAGTLPIREFYYIFDSDIDRQYPLDVPSKSGALVEGGIVLDSEMKDRVTLVCVDGQGNAVTASTDVLWIDKTAPEIEMGDENGKVVLVPPATLNTSVTDSGSGLSSVVYQLDDAPAVAVSGGAFHLDFTENGEHKLKVSASDAAGNVRQFTADISVNVAPIMTITLPTDIELTVLSMPVGDNVNIFSREWDVINQSNVPVRATITEYRMDSGFTGDMGASTLSLRMRCQSKLSNISLGYEPRTDLYSFTLDKAEYTKTGQYISSGAGARATFSYQGFTDREFNDYLRLHKATFHLAFRFEPIIVQQQRIETDRIPDIQGGLEQ